MGAADDVKSTEIRAEEKARGGMSYEVILSQAAAERPISPPTVATSPTQVLTKQDIDLKLEQAEERRKTLEAERVSTVTERLSRLQDAARKRQEHNDEFVAATAATISEKYELFTTNRQAHLDGIKAKVADHLCMVAGVRRATEEQTEKLRDDLNTKMISAQDNRDDHLRAILAKLQEHEALVVRVRDNHEAAVAGLQEKIKVKQEQANCNRELELQRKLDVLRQHLSKVEGTKEELSHKAEEQVQKLRTEIKEHEAKIVKLREEKLCSRVAKTALEKVEKVQHTRERESELRVKEVEEKIKSKLCLADKNKADLAKKAKSAREEQERRADSVRANKERLVKSSSADEVSGASSG